MPDCFITTNGKRKYLAGITETSLVSMGLCPKFVLTDMFKRYYACASLSDTELFVMSDDDIVLAYPDSVKEGAEIMKQIPEIGILGFAYKRELKYEDLAGWLRGKITERVWEIDHTGGINIIRKGIFLGEIPNLSPDFGRGMGDDKLAAKVCRESGYKVAILCDRHFYHLGDGQSTVWA